MRLLHDQAALSHDSVIIRASFVNPEVLNWTYSLLNKITGIGGEAIHNQLAVMRYLLIKKDRFVERLVTAWSLFILICLFFTSLKRVKVFLAACFF